MISQDFPSCITSVTNTASNVKNEKTNDPLTKITKPLHDEMYYINKFPEVLTDKLDKTRPIKGPPMHLHLKKEKIRPCYLTVPRKIPLQLEEKAKVFLDEAVKSGVLVKVNDPTEWLNPAIFLQKSDGTVRLVVDLRILNSVTERIVHPFPSAYEIVQSIKPSSKYFAKFDLLQGYHQIPLDEESTEKFSFLTKFGVYKFLRLPQGSSCSSGYFCLRTDQALAGS